MKIYRWRLRCDRRKGNILFFTIVTIANFGIGLFVISSVISFIEKPILSSQLIDIQKSEIEIMDKGESTINEGKLNLSEEIIIKQDYQHYFRIDYTIIQGICKSIYLFNKSTNILSIQNLTNNKLNLLTRNININVEILSINAIITKTDKIRQGPGYKSIKTVCSYILELYIAFSIRSYCPESCQIKLIKYLTSRTRPFGHPVDKSFTFILYSSNIHQTQIEYQIQHVLFYKSSKYYNKTVYIQSYDDTYYVSGLILDLDGYQTSLTMSKYDRSLFLIKNGLDKNTYENDCSSIYVSILSLLAPNTYLRHESGRIKLRKNDQTTLFKQDSTFKLLIYQDKIAFQSTNLPQSYMAVDSDTNTAIVLVQPTKLNLTDEDFYFKSKDYDQIFNYLNKTFLFKLVFY